ncbi:hypothetical protein G7Y31_11620 [Corynebacterium lizhenjunii]|uniref:MarR family transcriptional regulator n=1 Tax=Corynebacterium lizhenjunii TaxID=2709394 RepID=A0A7T0KFI2_9CORY|nr:hypothetical protein [Corynebacterium lizhenjunii]QPK79119.1 hypothetical protein G7Y31_11620 [Corynebacterium lizhenjunii]
MSYGAEATRILAYVAGNEPVTSHHVVAEELGMDLITTDEALLLLERRGLVDFWISMVGDYVTIQTTAQGAAFAQTGQQVE